VAFQGGTVNLTEKSREKKPDVQENDFFSKKVLCRGRGGRRKVVLKVYSATPLWAGGREK